MAFENNQQDAFNLRNDTESLKLFQAELDKATTSIGAAEVAAEEELAKLKLKNLEEQQKARLQQLDRLIAQEEAGIRDLARARLTLSDRQFELRKKEIQKEFQLSKKAAEELFKLEGKQVKKTSGASKKQSYDKDESATSKHKQTVAIEKDNRKTNNQELLGIVKSIDKTLSSLRDTATTLTKSSNNKSQAELTGLVGSINKTLSSLQNSVTSFAQAKEGKPSINVEPPVASATKDIKAAVETSPEAISPKTKNIQQQDPDSGERASVKDAESKLPVELTAFADPINSTLESLKSAITTFAQDSNNPAQAEIVDLVSSIDQTLEALHDTVTGLGKSGKKGKKSSTKAQGAKPSTTEDIKASAPDRSKNTNATTGTGGGGSTNSTTNEAKSNAPKERNYTDSATGLKEADLGYSFESIVIGFESLQKTLAGKGQEQTKLDLESIVSSKDENGQVQAPQESINAAGELLKHIEAANESERKLKEFNEASILTKRLRAADEEHQLRQKHADDAQRAAKESESIAAKAKDLEANRQKYIDEERLALENNFAKTRNELTSNYIKTEEALAYALSHKKELLEQEGQKLRNEHSEAAYQAELAINRARARAEDLEVNNGKNRAEAKQALELAHIQERNKLTEDIIKAEEKRNDLLHNKKLYKQEEEAALNKTLIDEQNKLTEDLYKTETSIAYTRVHKQELLDLESQKLKNERAAAYDKYQKDMLAEEAKAKDLELNKNAYRNKELHDLELGYAKEQNKIKEEGIKASAELDFVTKNEEKLQAQELAKLQNEHIQTETALRKENIKALAKSTDLEKNRDKYLTEATRRLQNEHTAKQNDLNQGLVDADAKADDLATNGDAYVYEETLALEKAFRDEQNRLTEDEYKRKAQLDYIEANEKKLTEQNLAALRSQHADEEVQRRKDHIKALARSTQLEEDRQTLLEDAKKKLADEHTNKQNDLKQGAVDNEAKAADLEDNKDQYILEARMARENAFYDERNRLEEERIKAEEEIAWNSAHRKELLEQEEQKVRLGYLAEYQQLQLDSTNHLTENITKEQYIALKEQTKAAEDSIARREKASAASEKALATIRGKGTIAEKKALLEAQVKERAAEKDWTGTKYEITDDMSEDEKAEIQKKRENAVKAEMAVNAAMGALANLAQKLNDQTDKIGEKQAPIDTRLQGSTVNDKNLGSYWKQLARDMNYIGAGSPYFKQEDFANNIETLVDKGISFDIKQRAFLMTIQEKIANTFDVADGTLLRLVRIQQEDTTAGRLGMESALNSFLNSMYETSEYLTDVAASVRGSLEEMQALMEGAAGTELEFQVQKWMGSLYSVGMSQEAVQSIVQTFGQIASGDVSGLTGSGTGNLLIMAANEAGMSIADILQDGLNADETNKLMQAMVNYLAEIAETSSDSRVVQQQLASVYGVKASDLKAATNLASSIKDVSNQDLTYSGMLGQLNKMADSMKDRTSTGEKLSNVWGNVQYTMATQMANDPILYLLPKVATLLEDYAGGIDLPFLNVMGFGVDLNTSVAQLMNVAAMSGSILGALGPMISGLSMQVGGNSLLSAAGINTSGKAPVIARGAPAVLQNVSGASISESGYIGNASGEDVKNATLQDAADSKKKQMVEAKDEESSDDVVIKSQLAVVSIYNLLEEVAHGSQSLRVRVVNNNGGAVSFKDMDTNMHTDNTKDTDNGNWVLSF